MALGDVTVAPIASEIESLPSLTPQTVKILLEWKYSLNSAAKHLANHFLSEVLADYRKLPGMLFPQLSTA